MPWIAEVPWRLAVLDEAQAIKNPDAKQTRAVKKLKAGARLALTGTPVENRLGDLWSIFDFVNPGLLGSAKEFTSFAKRLADTAPRLLWPAARIGAAVYSAAAEDRQDGHRGPAGQNRNQGVLPAQPQAGRALRAGGEGTGRTTRGRRPAYSAKGWCWRS